MALFGGKGDRISRNTASSLFPLLCKRPRARAQLSWVGMGVEVGAKYAGYSQKLALIDVGNSNTERNLERLQG